MQFDIINTDSKEMSVMATNLISQASRAVIESPKQAEAGADLTKLLKVQKKKWEDKRKELVGPLNETVKKINSEFKLSTAPIDIALLNIKSKLDTYIRNQA